MRLIISTADKADEMITMTTIQPDRYHRFAKTKKLTDLIVGIKGAGEMATGVACSLHKANIFKLFMLEIEYPLAVRRTVSFCDTIYSGRCNVEGVEAVVACSIIDIQKAWDRRAIAVIQDPEWRTVSQIRPDVVIDATLAKKNLGTRKDEAPLVIGMGPGFEAGKDVHLVIETHRGHNLGRIIERGAAFPNTGVPGNIGGHTHRRVLRSPCDGIFETPLEIGTVVQENQPIGKVGEETVTSPLSGVLRGLIHTGLKVEKGLKIGDIDPRGEVEYCYTISDKARALGGGVLQAILFKLNTSGRPSSSLARAIALDRGGVVSLIGAGGKTSLMFKLAQELAAAGGSVLTTTTTKIFHPDEGQSPHTIVEASWDRLLNELSAAVKTMPHFSAGTEIDPNSGKLIGLPHEFVDRIWQSGLFDVIIVEADGSKQMPTKATAAHEPVIPLSTSHLVHVTGLDAIGQPAESAVHRPEIFLRNLALATGTQLTESHLANNILWEIQKAERLCQPLINTVILNKADTELISNQGKVIADRLMGQACIHQLAILALNEENPVKYITRIR